jgi:hypothetical protein
VFKKIFRIVKIGILSGIPILLLLLPANYFDTGKSISIFAMLGVEGYYSEGLTRACMHLIHFDFIGASRYNSLSYFVVPILAILWISALSRELSLLWNSQRTDKPEKASLPKSNRFAHFRNAPLALLIFLPAIGFALALNEYFIPETSLTFAISMPITVVMGMLSAVTYHNVKKRNWPQRFLGAGIFSVVAISGIFLMLWIFPPVS